MNKTLDDLYARRGDALERKAAYQKSQPGGFDPDAPCPQDEEIARLTAEIERLETEGEKLCVRCFLKSQNPNARMIASFVARMKCDECGAEEYSLFQVDSLPADTGLRWTEAVVAAGENYDATPCPKQPIVKFDEVDEIPF